MKHADRHTVAACCTTTHQRSEGGVAARLAHAGVLLIIILAGYRLLKVAGIVHFTTATEQTAGLWSILLIGVAASLSSCLALVGGLLLSIAAEWSHTHPHATTRQRMLPIIGFNLGRLTGYFFLGGLTGLLGTTLTPSLATTGVLKIALSIIMIGLGLRLLGLFPDRWCRIPGTDRWTRWLHASSLRSHGMGSVLLGALTYLVPCGFTQSMQLVALGSGSFLAGGLIMLAFALGTLPALLGIGAMSSLAHGKIGRLFFSVAGALSIFLGIGGIQSGLLLSNIDLFHFIPTNAAPSTNDAHVFIDKNGQQILSVTVRDEGYDQDQFTVTAGIPTWIYATVPSPLQGCIASFAIPAFNILQPLKVGANWIGPITPDQDFSFMCSMGMFRANVRVVPQK